LPDYAAQPIATTPVLALRSTFAGDYLPQADGKSREGDDDGDDVHGGRRLSLRTISPPY
jgi:hypothetical protein